MKRCNKCGDTKSLESFHRRKRNPDGRVSTCKVCKRAYDRSRYIEDPQRFIGEESARRQADPASYQEKRRARRVANPGPYRESDRRRRAKDPDKIRARQKVFEAIAAGRIDRPTTCSTCGNTHSRIEGHHEDYSKPLEVIWLCAPCHGKLHMQTNTGEER